MLIISMAIFGMAVVFIGKIHSASSAKVDQFDDETNLNMIRTEIQGKKAALGPETIHEQGIVLLMIANDAKTGSSKFGFKVFYDTCLNGPCGVPSPIDWISYPTKGSEDDPLEIKPYESAEYVIAVNPTGNPPSGTYIFDVEVRSENEPTDGAIVYDELHPDVDDLYSRMKFYVVI